VRDGIVTAPGDWLWSSYPAQTGQALPPRWLDSDAVPTMLLACPTDTQQRRPTAQACDATLMKVNRNTPLWPDALHQQLYLADETFVQRMQAQAGAPALRCTQVPRRQRADPTTLSGWLSRL